MNALKEVSKVWLVAKMVHTLFESILGNKMLEEKLQRAAGKRHKKPRLENRPASGIEDQQQQQKRKYDDMDFPISNGPPAPQVSYERSRPQTPAVTPSRDLGQHALASMNAMAAPQTSDNIRQPNDAFMGSSRNNTRPPTPFNPQYPNVATPPDLYLVTRESPHISQNLWENFQPDQLFPESTNIAMPQYPGQQQNLDPQLQMPQMHSPAMLQPPMGQGGQQMPQMSGMGQIPPGMQQQQPNAGWQGPFPGDSPEDNWSNSSRGGPVAPTALNVEDWCVCPRLLGFTMNSNADMSYLGFNSLV